MSSTEAIERSFELTAERCADLTPLVYRRLHAERPETRTLFRTEGSLTSAKTPAAHSTQHR